MATEIATAETWEMGPPSDTPNIVELMVKWFFENFEDPAHRTPCDEGEYVWIWGGPYDAREELERAFGALVRSHAMEQAVAEIEADGGLEWAPAVNRMQPEAE